MSGLYVQVCAAYSPLWPYRAAQRKHLPGKYKLLWHSPAHSHSLIWAPAVRGFYYGGGGTNVEHCTLHCLILPLTLNTRFYFTFFFFWVFLLCFRVFLASRRLVAVVKRGFISLLNMERAFSAGGSFHSISISLSQTTGLWRIEEGPTRDQNGKTDNRRHRFLPLSCRPLVSFLSGLAGK